MGLSLDRIEEGTREEAVVNEEQELLQRVLSRLAETSAKQGGAGPDFRSDMEALRDQIAEVNPDDVPMLVDQMIQIEALSGAAGRGRGLPVDPQNPYFAHIRLQEEGSARDVMIGRRGFVDASRGVRIVDWRNAPVSRIYYRYQEGDEYEETFGRREVVGEVLTRRSVSIRGGTLRRINTPEQVLLRDEQGDWRQSAAQGVSELGGGRGTAQRPEDMIAPSKVERGTLGLGAESLHRSDKHLPAIAALIDPEQFDLITQPDSGLIILQGGAGTGKTTVALHRVAYLTFAYPKKFQPKNMVIVVRHPALVRYIDQVLPALDVRGVKVSTFGNWARRLCREALQHLPEGHVSDPPPQLSRLKQHPALLIAMEQMVDEQADAVELSLREATKGQAGAGRVIKRWQQSARESLVERLHGLLRWCVQMSDRRLSPIARAGTESVVNAALPRAGDVLTDWEELLSDRARITVAMHRWAEMVPEGTPPMSAQHIEDSVQSFMRQLRDIQEARSRRQGDEPDEVNVLSPIPGLIPGAKDKPGPAETAERGETGLDDHDYAILLRFTQLKHGALMRGKKRVKYDHVVVDEAQDLSPLEIKTLVETTGQRQSVTLAGDTAQKLVFDNGFEDWDTLQDYIGIKGTEVGTLRVSYRSTAPIVQFARDVLGHLAPPDAPQAPRPGPEVQLYKFGEIGEAVAMLADALRSLMLREPSASVALIGRFAEQVDRYAEALGESDVPNIRRVYGDDFRFKPGIEACEIAQVKGLEFDYAVIVECSARAFGEDDVSRHLLHIAATRAAHQLWLTSTGTPSPLIPQRVLDLAL